MRLGLRFGGGEVGLWLELKRLQKKKSQTQNEMKNKQKAPQNQNPKRLYIKKKIAPVLGVPWNISRDILKKN